jgi:Polyketide cyclase / dehydrase and lipid transport
MQMRKLMESAVLPYILASSNWVTSLDNRACHRVQCSAGRHMHRLAPKIDIHLCLAVDRLDGPLDAAGATPAIHLFYEKFIHDVFSLSVYRITVDLPLMGRSRGLPPVFGRCVEPRSGQVDNVNVDVIDVADTRQNAPSLLELYMNTDPIMPVLPRHFECSAYVPAPAEQVFVYADDQTRLSSHMSESSSMMGGDSMHVDLDDGQGQRVGSHIRLTGRAFGVELAVEEIVTERVPPERKAWVTVGQPNLLVIGHYRMGFEASPQGKGTQLRVFIDYALPVGRASRWLGYLLADYYARWCTRQMAKDAAAHFQSQVSKALP